MIQSIPQIVVCASHNKLSISQENCVELITVLVLQKDQELKLKA